VVGLTHDQLDVTAEPAVVAAVRDHEPELVVHAAAWTDVDGCERDPDRAHRVNALGAWWVARACHLARATMVHVSTDYVFDGSSTQPYTEFDPIAPVSAYGRSKAAGEDLVRATLREHHIVRTAWVCGARGRNFVATMLRVGEEGRARVVDDQVGAMTYTRDLADAIRELAVTGRYGTWHRTNSGTGSWFDLAAATFELAGLDVELEAMKSDELDRPAPRPAYSVLSDRHAVAAGLRVMPDWRDALRRLLAEMGRLAPGAAT
jgi:dTDP-4-dehydrorhamnose reductase